MAHGVHDLRNGIIMRNIPVDKTEEIQETSTRAFFGAKFKTSTFLMVNDGISGSNYS